MASLHTYAPGITLLFFRVLKVEDEFRGLGALYLVSNHYLGKCKNELE